MKQIKKPDSSALLILANDLQKSHITIQRTINTLVQKRLLIREGSTKTGYWILNI